MKQIVRNPLFGIAGAGIALFFGFHFVKLAVLPRLPGGTVSQ